MGRRDSLKTLCQQPQPKKVTTLPEREEKRIDFWLFAFLEKQELRNRMRHLKTEAAEDRRRHKANLGHAIRVKSEGRICSRSATTSGYQDPDKG